MKIEKVVYLIQTPFNKRDNDRFGVCVFLSHNIEVEVLDLSAFIDKEVAKNYASYEKDDFSFVNKLDCFTQIKKYILATSENTIFMSFIGESSVKSLRVLDFLYKNNKEFGIILSGSLPTSGNKQKLLTKFKMLTPKTIKRLVSKAIYLSFFKKFHYSFVITSGEKSQKLAKIKYSQSKIINGHAFDYDLFLGNIDMECNKDKEYAIFMDEFFPFHPDYILNGVDYSAFADSYYKKLCVLFDKIEKQYSLKVIIAAHPRSNYDQLPDYWKGREFITGETINLVKDAKICLLHASTSVNFAVLNEKPIVFVTMDEVKKSNVQLTLDAMAKELDISPLDLDSKYEKINAEVKLENYEKYINKYIKSSTSKSQINNWEILYRYFR